MIQAVGLTKGFATQVLFENIGFTLGKGERIGLAGRNGSGKSTLFKIILGEESPDQGEIIIPKNYRIGTLKQHLFFTESSILKEGLTALPVDERFDEYKVEKMLMGLGFKKEDMIRAPSEFSGGYQIRLNLAKVLLEGPDCLLLDEPTNYLDIVSMRWLGKFLRNFKGELIIITHDRGFMNGVTTHTMGIWRQKLLKIAGNTEKYFEQLLLEEDIQEKTRVNSEKRRKELEDFVNRFRAKATKAAQAQSRLKLLEKMPQIEALAIVSTLDFEFNYKECPGKVLLEAKDLSFGYGQELLFKDLAFTISKGEKVAIIGKNGKGKSTLLNLLAGELVPTCGSVSKNVNLLVGHFGQTNINRLSMENTVEEEMATAGPDLSRDRIRAICGAMMFSGDLATKKIKVLSGGERARVLLGKLLARPTNLLLLDEPTNHLDQESIEALTLELQNYPGAVIIVTHSEGLLRSVANSLIVFHESRAEHLRESYDGFLTKIGWEDEREEQAQARAIDRPSRQELKRLRSEAIIERSREASPYKKKMETFEKKIMDWEEEQGRLEALLIELASQGDSKKIQEVSQRLSIVKKSIDEVFEELTEVALVHDEIMGKWEIKLKGLET